MRFPNRQNEKSLNTARQWPSKSRTQVLRDLRFQMGELEVAAAITELTGLLQPNDTHGTIHGAAVTRFDHQAVANVQLIVGFDRNFVCARIEFDRQL
jgi:hypothetical protein